MAKDGLMQDTNPLVLEILKQAEALAMSIFEQRELTSTLRHYSKLEVSFAQINKLCRETVSIINKADRKDGWEMDSAAALKKTGQLLGDHLLTKPIKERLRRSQNSDLILSLDEELISIPWELLHTGEDFLCLRFNLGRLVRTRQQSSPAQYRSHSSRPRMLILANPTNDLKSAYMEGAFIRNQFDRRRKEVSIDFKSTNIDTLYVKKNLRDYEIVHFAGHCEYDDDEPANTGWVLSDGRFCARDICAMAETESLPSLVFSNACQSAEVSQESLNTDCQERIYSLASAFIFSGVRHYIGTVRKVEDKIGLAFAREFYGHLISGKTVGECMRLSRLGLIKEYGSSSIWWVNYLLYGDPGFALFGSKLQAKKAKFKKRIASYKRLAKGLALAAAAIIIIIYLYMWLPALNPNAYVLLLRSRSLFNQGRNQEAILSAERIIKSNPLFLAAYPLLADAYQRQGKSEEALRYYFEYIRACEKRQDKKSLSRAYTGIGWVYHLSGQYPKAFDFYNKAIALSRDNKDFLNEAIASRKLAVWYMDKEDYNKALELLMKSSGLNQERQSSFEHRYNLACDYFDIGLVFTNRDDFITARQFYAKSRRLFEKLNLKAELSDYYFNLGETYLFDKEYQKALDYYMKGLKIDMAAGNLPGIAADYNMLGELYSEMGNAAEAEKYFMQAVSVAGRIYARPELAAAYYNLGLLYKQDGRKSKARDYLRQAQEIYSHIDTTDYQRIKQDLLELN
jgi:tetratricopeptide (TPR) repeat protein/CHAT domain-containing protein